MRRILAYNGQIPFTADILNTNRNFLKAIGLLAQDVLGSATSVAGLACGPTTPASLAVSIAAGRIYSLQAVDSSAYSDIGTDTDQVVKQGILAAAITLNCPAPVTTGQSINYLIEAQYQDSDANSQVLPYYNAANPASPLSGPGGVGTPQNTQRDGIISLVSKAGFPATTGTQVTPAPDAGYVGLWVVTVIFGATTVLAGNIVQAAGAPFIPSNLATALTSTSLAALLTQAYLGAIVYPTTFAEGSALVTPLNFIQPPQFLPRYRNNVSPGVTDMVLGLQAAIDSASADRAVVSFGNANVISKPLLLKAITEENISLVGNSRVSTVLGATAADIHTAGQGINCIIFNQNNNIHLHLKSFEFSCAAAFTGVCIYCVEGGGTDSSGQALFSSVFEDMWMGMPNVNGGFLKGGVQNCKFHDIEVEGCATAVYNLQGVGCGDVFFGNHSMVSCFDSYILQTADTNGSFMMTVDGLHAYDHKRGPLISVQNWLNSTINNINLEVAASNSGSTGLFNFNNCTGLTVTNSKAVQRAGLGLAATVCIVSGTSQIEFIGGQWQGSIGALLNGTGVMDLIFDGVDMSACTTAGMECNGNFSGTIRTRGCKFNNQQGYGFVNQVTGSMNWYSEDDEFINAGLGGNAATRNISVSTAGVVVIKSPTIGQNNGSAAAASYIENDGTGQLTIIHPTWVGAPPTSYLASTSTGPISIIPIPGPGGTIASAASITMPVNGDSLTVTGTTGITSIAASGYNFPGRRMTLIFTGVLTVTSGSNLKLNGNYTTAANTTLSLIYDGTNWNETARG